ncbi:MAG: hypothetical protein IPJ86_01050 [Bacteroidetes bacterium]|nr:hypothetical protein [Bacteroidota bacterium]
MKKIYALLVICILTIDSNAQTIPTWSENIACILYTRCTSCHNPSGIAPFSLVDYANASGAAAGIYDAVINNRMPPWPPDPTYRSFAHEKNLTPQEKQLIIDWVSNGTPLGNPGNAPVPPVYTNAEVIQNPDLTLRMPVYTIPPITADLYRCFAIPSNTTIDQFITGVEVVPGNRQVVHHVLVFQDTANTTLLLDSLDPAPGYNGFGGVGSNSAKLVGIWVPGAEPVFQPLGMGLSIPAGSTIIFQVHYPVGSSFQQDSTKVNFEMTPVPTTREVTVAPILNHGAQLTNGPLFIPADSTRTFYSQLTTPFNLTLLSVAPHMHLIGRSIKSWAVTLLNDTIPFIDIPAWNFMWQGNYQFRQPLRIPALSSFHGEAFYDNTVNNPLNPSIPPQDVSQGEATTDEMMLIYFYFLTYQPGDENIIIDTSTVINTYNNCNFVTDVAEVRKELSVNFYPNPASGKVIVDLPPGGVDDIRMVDMSGRLVWRKDKITEDFELTLEGYKNGLYELLFLKEGVLSRKSLLIAQ